MDNKLENITWDNSQAYKGFDDPNMSSDLEMAEKMKCILEGGGLLPRDAT